MKAARRIAGLVATVALLATPGAAQAAPPQLPPGTPSPPAESCYSFQKGIWTCYTGGPYSGPGMFEIRASRYTAVGEYGDCTDSEGLLGTPSIVEYEVRYFSYIDVMRYGANGRVIGPDQVYTYSDWNWTSFSDSTICVVPS
jgi:hypothetical protein